MSLLWWNESIEKSLSSENQPLGNGFVRKIVNKTLSDMLLKYVQFNVCQMPERMCNPQRFPAGLPVTILRKDKTQLLDGLHLHSEKIDGLRHRFIALKLCSDLDLNSVAKSTINLSSEHKQQEQFISLTAPKKEYMTRQKREQVQKDKAFQDLVREARIQTGMKVTDFANEENEEKTDIITIVDESETSTTSVQVAPVKRQVKSVQYLVALLTRKNEFLVLNTNQNTCPDIEIKESLFPCVLDGELTLHMPTNRYHYLIFNITMSNGYHWKQFALQDRVDAYNELLNSDLIRVNDSSPFLIKPKQWNSWHQFNLVLERSQNGPYKSDGVVATLNRSPAVEFGTDYSTFKFKNEHTIDFRVEQDPNDSSMAVFLKSGFLDDNGRLKEANDLFVETRQSLATFFTDIHGERNNLEWKSGGIYETIFNPETGLYHACMLRDKDIPNNAAVIKATHANIVEGMNPEEIYQTWKAHQHLIRRNACSAPSLEKEEAILMYDRTHAPKGFLKSVIDQSNWSELCLPDCESVKKELQRFELSWKEVSASEKFKICENTSTSNTVQRNFTALKDVTGLKKLFKNKRGFKRALESKPKKSKKVKIEEVIVDEHEDDNDDDDEDDEEVEDVSNDEAKVHCINEQLMEDFEENVDDEEDEDFDEEEEEAETDDIVLPDTEE